MVVGNRIHRLLESRRVASLLEGLRGPGVQLTRLAGHILPEAPDASFEIGKCAESWAPVDGFGLSDHFQLLVFAVHASDLGAGLSDIERDCIILFGRVFDDSEVAGCWQSFGDWLVIKAALFDSEAGKLAPVVHFVVSVECGAVIGLGFNARYERLLIFAGARHLDFCRHVKMQHLGALPGLSLQPVTESEHLPKRVQKHAVVHAALDLTPVMLVDLRLKDATHRHSRPVCLCEAVLQKELGQYLPLLDLTFSGLELETVIRHDCFLADSFTLLEGLYHFFRLVVLYAEIALARVVGVVALRVALVLLVLSLSLAMLVVIGLSFVSFVPLLHCDAFRRLLAAGVALALTPSDRAGTSQSGQSR